jgi:hypothetical protein
MMFLKLLLLGLGIMVTQEVVKKLQQLFELCQAELMLGQVYQVLVILQVLVLID